MLEGESSSRCGRLAAEWGTPGTQYVNLTRPEMVSASCHPAQGASCSGMVSQTLQNCPTHVATGQQLEDLCHPSGRHERRGRAWGGVPLRRNLSPHIPGWMVQWGSVHGLTHRPAAVDSMKFLPDLSSLPNQIQ